MRRPELRLFCFPPAGGSRASFRGWSKILPAGVELGPVEPPGRAMQRDRPPFRRLEPLLDHLEATLADSLRAPYALYGLSMGSLVAYELARRRAAIGTPPLALFVGGHRAPHLPRRFGPWHDLPEAELLEEVRALGGLPDALVDRRWMLAPMLETVRADAEVVEIYSHHPAPPLPCPITAFLGERDPMVNRDELDAWRSHGSEPFELVSLDCGHFPEGAEERRLVVHVGERLGHLHQRLLS